MTERIKEEIKQVIQKQSLFYIVILITYKHNNKNNTDFSECDQWKRKIERTVKISRIRPSKIFIHLA